MRSEPMGPMMTVVNRITAKFRAPVSPPPQEITPQQHVSGSSESSTHAVGASPAAAASSSAPQGHPRPAAMDTLDDDGKVKGWM